MSPRGRRTNGQSLWPAPHRHPRASKRQSRETMRRTVPAVLALAALMSGAVAEVDAAEDFAVQRRQMVDEIKTMAAATAGDTGLAPRAGRIVEASVGPGASIDAMAPAVVLDTGDELWVEAQLPALATASVSTKAYPAQCCRSAIRWIQRHDQPRSSARSRPRRAMSLVRW